MSFSLVGKKMEKTMLQKPLYFSLVSGSIQVFRVKLLACNTNHQETARIIKSGPKGPRGLPLLLTCAGSL